MYTPTQWTSMVVHAWTQTHMMHKHTADVHVYIQYIPWCVSSSSSLLIWTQLLVCWLGNTSVSSDPRTLSRKLHYNTHNNWLLLSLSLIVCCLLTCLRAFFQPMVPHLLETCLIIFSPLITSTTVTLCLWLVWTLIILISLITKFVHYLGGCQNSSRAWPGHFHFGRSHCYHQVPHSCCW